MTRALAVWIATALFTSAQAAERPNVVLFLADDMGLGDTSAYQDFTGNPDDVQIDTPAMERLARMGVRFTDAHTPASRCTPTRYALLTGRYAWRSRMKHWVLFGAQGDPLIEPGRPTIASMLHDRGYRTGMFGKWHVGLRYRQTDGRPAAGWDDADLTQSLFDTPIDHGFDVARFTSRSHGTSGPNARPVGRKKGRRNGPQQSIGPGHIHGRAAIGATDIGKQLATEGRRAYVLTELGGRHSDNAIEFLEEHLGGADTRESPFFMYYASNSNHSPYTPDTHVGEAAVKGAARTKDGTPMNSRGDFVYENDVSLGRLIDWLETHDDPRRPGEKLIGNTIVIFTSDNGAERDNDVNTGPFRSHKGSCYEGGHRVPFLVAWPAGSVGDGDPKTPGRTSDEPIGLHEVFGTLAEAAGAELPDPRKAEIGGEDTRSVLAAWRGKPIPRRPMFYHDHKQAKDPAVAAMRLDVPDIVGDRVVVRKWKIFFDAALLRAGAANATELYDLASDPREERNRVDESGLGSVVAHLSDLAIRHRTAGGHRLAKLGADRRVEFDWASKRNHEVAGRTVIGLADLGVPNARTSKFLLPVIGEKRIAAQFAAVRGDSPADGRFTLGPNGLGYAMSKSGTEAFDRGEALLVRFPVDVLVESAAIVAGDGSCGGSCTVGKRSPVAIYCVDADIDAKDQSGILSDLGVLPAGETLRFDTRPHLGVEAAGSWRLRNLVVRVLDE